MTRAVSAGALVFYVLGLLVTFGLRAVLHRRRTGSWGMHGISGWPLTLPWWGGALFVLAIVLGLAAPASHLLGGVEAPDELVDLWPVGVVTAVIGLGIIVTAQADMGSSWAVGVDGDAPPTALVVTGLFRIVRNPVFSGMIVAHTGMLLMVPTAVSVASLLCLVAAVEIQVRVLEEPYLLGAHGEDYVRYASRAGRLLPFVGRLDGRSLEDRRTSQPEERGRHPARPLDEHPSRKDPHVQPHARRGAASCCATRRAAGPGPAAASYPVRRLHRRPRARGGGRHDGGRDQP